jgi:HD-like signal output (HDOD) protein
MRSAPAYSPGDVLSIADTFPATQQVLAQLSVLLRSPDAGLEEVSRLLKQDVSLAARLIRVANSAVFAQDLEVASVEDAVSLVGFREIYRLVGIAVMHEVGEVGLPTYGVSPEQFRSNSLFTALLMEELAVGAEEDARFCYTVGLLRSIGKVALDRLARTRPAEGVRSFADDEGVADWERSAFGLTSAEAAAIILRKWRFPHEIISAIEGHYDVAGKLMPLTHLLNLSAGVAEVLGHGLPGETVYWVDSNESYRKAGITKADASGIIDHALQTFNRLANARL